MLLLQQGALFKLALLQIRPGVIGNGRTTSLTKSNQFLLACSLFKLMWVFFFFFLENVRLWGRKQTIQWNSLGLAEVRLCYAIMNRKQWEDIGPGWSEMCSPKISCRNSILFRFHYLEVNIICWLKVPWKSLSYHPIDNPCLFQALTILMIIRWFLKSRLFENPMFSLETG